MSSGSKTVKLSPERVRRIALKHGYQELPLAAREQNHMLSFSHHSKPCGPVRIDVYFTTGKVTTSLEHPVRGKGQLQRDFQPDYDLLEKIFVNPRYHSDSGYHTREEKKRREQMRRQEAAAAVSDEDADIPEEFYGTKWPHPRLLKNRPTGQDEALVWFLENERKNIENYIGKRVTNKNSYVNVRATGKFRCHLCKKMWTSHFAWILFDMKNMQVKRMYGQKCNKCLQFYSRPLPFFFSEPEDLTKSNGTTPWRDIVLKAIDLWIHRNIKKLPYDPDRLEEDDSIIDGGEDNTEAKEEEEERPCKKGLPHDESLCEMCEIYKRNCTRRTTGN